jgi:hypothetical protein
MSNTAFDRAINFGVTAHPEVGRVAIPANAHSMTYEKGGC